MQIGKTLAITFCLLLPFLGRALFAQTNSPSGTSNPKSSVPGVRFFLTLPKATFTNGESIIASAVLTNLTERPINVPDLHGALIELAIINGDNRAVSSLDDGHGSHVGGPLFFCLAPHGCHTNFLDISSAYNLATGGYRICARRPIDLEGSQGRSFFTSEVVTIKIVAPAVKGPVKGS